MRQSTAVAFGFSVILHIAIALCVWLLRAESPGTTATPVLSLNLISAVAQAVETAPQQEASNQQHQAPHTPNAPTPEALRQIEQTANTVELPQAPQVTQPERNTDDADSAEVTPVATAAMTAKTGTEPLTTPENVVTTIGPGDRSVSSQDSATDYFNSGRVSAVTARQEKMLQSRFRKFAADYNRKGGMGGAVQWRHKGQDYVAEFEKIAAVDATGIEQVAVTVSTVADGQRMVTGLVMTRLAFSNFGQFVNRWDPRVEIHDDEIDGRFHSNSGVNLSYEKNVKPVFHGKVTIAGGGISISNGRGRLNKAEIFAGGLETRARSIALPRRAAVFGGSDEPDPEQVHYLKKDTRIVFDADGSYTWSGIEVPVAGQRRQLGIHPYYIVADGKHHVHVRGTVNGSVLVYTPARIVIEGDITYASNPKKQQGSDDYLGLVSEQSVEIAAQKITGPGDLTIQAAVYARRHFRVRDYRRGDTAILYLYGSLTAGSLAATEPRFRTRLEFDQRLNTRRPPAFPMTGQYETGSWDGVWTHDTAPEPGES